MIIQKKKKGNWISAITDFLPWDNLEKRDTKIVAISLEIDSGGKKVYTLFVFDIKLKIKRRNCSKYSA